MLAHPTLNRLATGHSTSEHLGKVMSDSDDISQLDDTALLLQRQAAADNGDEERKARLDTEVARRALLIRAALGGGR